MFPQIDSDTLESELSQLREADVSREQINDTLGELGRTIGLDDLTLDGNGVAELTVDDTLELSLIHLPNFPGIIAAIAMPEGFDGNAAVLRRLLQVNMSWSLTQGGSFVMAPPQLALCRLVPMATCDSALLDRELAAFVALGKAWHTEIKSFQPPPRQAESLDRDHPDENFVGLKV